MTPLARRSVAPLLALALLAAAPGIAGRQKRAGNQLLAEGRFEEALAAYREGLAKAPEDPELHINAGAALYRLARPRDAAEEFRRGMALASDPAVRRTALYDEGTALLEAGDAAAAAARLRQVLLEDPTDDSARRNLEIALARQADQAQDRDRKSGAGDDGEGGKGESRSKPEAGESGAGKPPDGNPGGGGESPPPEAGKSPAPPAGAIPPQPGDDAQPPFVDTGAGAAAPDEAGGGAPARRHRPGGRRRTCGPLSPR